MYKDDGKINVELLAEVGDIAQRLRNLDKRLALDLNDPRYLQQLQHYQGVAASAASKSEPQCSERRPSLAAQIAQDISDRLSASAGTSDTESSPSSPSHTSQQQPQPPSQQQRRYSSKQVEDIILEFYEKHLIYHQQKVESERSAKTVPTIDEPKRSRIYRLTSGDSYNMSNVSTSTDPAKCSTSNFDENAVRNLDGANSSIDRAGKPSESIPESTRSELETTTTTSTSTTAVTPTTSAPAGGKRNSFANQPMPEIQISNSDEQPKKCKSLSEQLPRAESKESTTIESSEEQQQQAGTYDTTAAPTGGNCGHYCAGWQTPSWSNQFDDNVLLTLVMELKHKVEFTERMNWLCKYPFISIHITRTSHRKIAVRQKHEYVLHVRLRDSTHLFGFFSLPFFLPVRMIVSDFFLDLGLFQSRKKGINLNSSSNFFL